MSGIAALVLAAGRSVRFGGDKVLKAIEGKPLGAHVADTVSALSLAHRLAVCPEGNAARRAIFSSRGFAVHDNPHPENGLASSLAIGAAAARAADADVLLVCLADMPFVTTEHLAALLAHHRDAGGIVASTDGTTRSPPAVFGRDAMAALTALSGDQGARGLLAGAHLVTAPAGTLRDFDTPADFAGS